MKYAIQIKERPELWPIYIAAFGWSLFAIVTQLWPASWWLEVRSVQIQNSNVGEAIVMDVDRSINRPFFGVWRTQTRGVNPDGTLTPVVCTASFDTDYKTESSLPGIVTLDWWTGGKCAWLPAGRYILSTSWRIEANGIWPDKRVSIDSNIFEVKL